MLLITSKITLSSSKVDLILVHRSKWADDWLQTLESVIPPIIVENRQNNHKLIRIAILDTGVDITHPQIQAAKEASKIVASFPECVHPTSDSDSKSHDPFQDLHGYGTQGRSPMRLYIARVRDGKGNLIRG